jgi:hypothetical protein
MKKPKKSFVVGVSLLVSAVMLVIWNRSQPDPNEDGPMSDLPTNAESPQRSESFAHRENASGRHEHPASDSATGNPQESAAAKESILEEIQDATVTYDAAELPKIETYLLHPDLEIRQAAMNGMIVLGDKAAGPLLRKAAALAPSPQEAVALLEAADYIELPSGTLRRKSGSEGGPESR